MLELVRKIAGDFLAFPTVIEVTEQATPAISVSQVLYHAPNLKTKINLLQHLFQNDEVFHRVIIFCKTKEVDHHSHVHNTRICSDGPVFDAKEVEI